MKDAKGHGSEPRGGGMARVSVAPSKIGHRMADIGPGGVEHNVTYGGNAEAASALAQGNPKADAAPIHPGAPGRQYYGSVLRGRSLKTTGPHPDRITARDAARAIAPKNAKFVSTGYGYNGSFDVRAHYSHEK